MLYNAGCICEELIIKKNQPLALLYYNCDYVSDVLIHLRYWNYEQKLIQTNLYEQSHRHQQL